MELLSEEAGRRGILSDGQFGSREGRLGIDVAANMLDRAYAAWTNGHITGVLLRDIKAAFPSVAKGRLVNLMKISQTEGDVIGCMERLLLERRVQMIIKATPWKDTQWKQGSRRAHLGHQFCMRSPAQD